MLRDELLRDDLLRGRTGLLHARAKLLRARPLLQAPLPPVARPVQQHEALLPQVVLRAGLLRNKLLHARAELLQLVAPARDAFSRRTYV